MENLVKLTVENMADILPHFELSDEAAEVVEETMKVDQSLLLLTENKHWDDAIRVLAHALPKRESIWWSCLCAKQALGDQPSPDSLSSISVAEQWAITPTEENRESARQWSLKTDQKTAASWAATAAFWAEGSMTEPGETEIPPPPYLYAHAVAGAVNLAAFQPDPSVAEEKLQRFIRQGIDLAQGGRGDVQ